jgi:ATP-dependent helicase HepA
VADVTANFPPGALLRDPRNPDALDIRVVSVDQKFLVVSIGRDVRQYILKETHLRRWLLPARTAVAIESLTDQEETRTGLVVGLREKSEAVDTWTYLVDTDTGTEELPEQRLRVLKIDYQDPIARLETNGWRGPKRFFARLGLLRRTTIWKQDSEGIPAFLGARIDPLFHQFYAARRCLLDRETRFLLADEVGLGKTIEAGLVIQSLLAAKQGIRVLVVTPGTTSRQWLAELYCRFGGRAFTHMDAVRYGVESRRTSEALLKSHCLIVTTSLLRTQPRALSIVTSQHWDLLVIDEGHHLSNWPDLMNSLRLISESAASCLVLTATPGRGDDNGLLELLKLVAPAIYARVAIGEFTSRLEPQRKIAEKLLYSEELINALLARGAIDEGDARELAGQWKGLFPKDPIVVERLAKMEKGDGEAAQELVAHIQEHYRVDRRVIRTRRRTLAEYGSQYSTRSLEHLEYDACAAEVATIEQVTDLVRRTDAPATWKILWSRLACTTPALLEQLLQSRLDALAGQAAEAASLEIDPCATDLGPAEDEAALTSYLERGTSFPGEKTWLQETLAQVQRWSKTEGHTPSRFVALIAWLDRRIRTGSTKILVFSQSRPVVNALSACLRARFGEDAVGAMTHDLNDNAIAEVARRFELRPQCVVLVSDEVGAEGHNFQFADAVVHLDQPILVARIEQRIGRLDRIGRNVDRTVLSVAVTGPSESERAILSLNRDLFGVYERSIGGLEYLLPRFQQVIGAASAGGAEALSRLGEELRGKLVEEEQRVDEAFSFFLDATRPELERAKKLSDLVADRSGEEDESYVRDWCKELRIDLVAQDGNCVKVEARVERLDAPLPAIGARDWIRNSTFSRQVALNDPAVQYLAPGHMFIDALLENAQDTHDARATIFFRDLGTQGRGRVFCVVVGRLGPDEMAFAGGAPAGILRRAEYYLPIEWVRSAFEILPEGDITQVPQGPLREGLGKDLQRTDRKCDPDAISIVVERFSGLWVGVRAAVSAAAAVILAHKQDEIRAAGVELEEALRSELAYLRSQKNSTASMQADRALEEREALLASIRSPSVNTDAVAIVIGSEGR